LGADEEPLTAPAATSPVRGIAVASIRSAPAVDAVVVAPVTPAPTLLVQAAPAPAVVIQAAPLAPIPIRAVAAVVSLAAAPALEAAPPLIELVRASKISAAIALGRGSIRTEDKRHQERGEDKLTHGASVHTETVTEALNGRAARVFPLRPFPGLLSPGSC
jgi:hypothetical protein